MPPGIVLSRALHLEYTHLPTVLSYHKSMCLVKPLEEPTMAAKALSFSCLASDQAQPVVALKPRKRLQGPYIGPSLSLRLLKIIKNYIGHGLSRGDENYKNYKKSRAWHLFVGALAQNRNDETLLLGV